MFRLNSKSGVALILTFVVLSTLTVIVFTYLVMVSYELKSANAEQQNIKAFYIAEAGRARARWALTTGEEDPGWGESDVSFGGGTYTVTTTDNGDDTVTITSSAYIPDDSNPVAQRQVIERNVAVIPGISDNYSPDAAATASSVNGGNTADKSNDENSASKWKSNVNNGSWLKHDFGSDIEFDRIVYDGNKIDSYTVEYSTDDVVYNGVANAVEDPAGTVTFDLVEARYLRFNVNGKKPEVNELETYYTTAGAASLGQGEFVTSW